MTRIPDLERELLVAAQRRYARAPRRRFPVARLLVPVAAALLIALVAGTALRGQDPEVEVPAGPPAGMPVTIEALRAGPLAGALDDVRVDPDVRPTSLLVSDGTGEEWLVAAYATGDNQTCVAATPADASPRENPDSSACVATGLLAQQARRRADLPWLHRAAADGGEGGRLLFGFVRADVVAAELVLPAGRHPAAVDDAILRAPVSRQEREARIQDGGRLPGGIREAKVRIFAAAVSALEAPEDVNSIEAELEMTYADGHTTAVSLHGMPADAPAPAACYREADLDADTAVPSGTGGPIRVCERFWENTGFANTPTPERLVACEGRKSVVWVFPGGPEVCARLGLKRFGDG